MQIKDVMTKDVITIPSDASIQDAAQKMRANNVGTIAVLDGDRLVGLLNDRQITIGVVAEGKDPGLIKVGDVMTSRLVTGNPEMDIMEAAKIMGKLHYRRLPVIDREHHLQGIVSVCDLSVPLRQFSDSILDEISKRGPTRPERFREPSTPHWLYA